MRDERKTKAQLINELAELRQQVAELEASEAERVQVEKALRESERRYRLLAENMRDTIWTMDMNLRFTYFSPSVARLGYAVEEVTSLTMDEFLTPASLEVAKRTFAEELAREDLEPRKQFSSRTLELAIRCKDGSTLWAEVRVSFLRDAGGEPVGMLGVARDITERKQAEGALRESEAKYRELVENANSIIFRMDTQGRVTFFNEFAQSFFGYTEDEILGRNVVGTLVPERDSSGQYLAGMIQDILEHPEEYANNENENVRRNGERVWVAWTNKAILDGSGRLTEILCVGNDITERKQAGEALRQSERKYRLLFENMTAGFALHEMIYDEQGQPADYRYLEINPAFEKLTGVPTSALLGKTVKEVLPNTEQYWIEVSGKVAQSGEPIAYQNYSGELGKYYDTWLFSPARDQFAVVFTDITDRVQAEREREKLIAQLQEALDNIKTLKGLIPICANCKKIRDDEGYWQDVAVYVRDHSEAEFSHGLCPDCAKQLYPEFFPNEE